MLRGNLYYFISTLFFLPPSHMSSSSLPHWHSLPKPSHDRISCHRNGFFRSFISISGIGVFSGAFLLVCLILYMTFFSPHGSLLFNSLDWHVLDANSTEHVGFNKSVSTSTNYNSSSPASEAPSSPSDVLSLEQIRDIVAPTRGFFSRDYSLNLGWNNVSIRGNQFLTELRTPNRCIILSVPPSSKRVYSIVP